MAYDGSIRINTKIDGKGFNTGIKGMMASLGSLAAAIGVVFSVQQMVQFGKKSVETAMQMEAGWQGLRYMANAYGKDLGHIKEFLNEFTEDGLVPMMNAQQAYKNMLARGYSTDQLEKMLLIMKDSSVYLRKGQLEIGEAIEKTTMGLRTERSILTDSSGIEKNMYKMWQAYAKEMGTTISALTHEQKLIAEFQGFMKEGAVYAGAAAEYTETYAGKVAQLTAAMVSLKVSVGNMIIPLLNAMLPKIIAMVQWFTYWFNIIGRVMNLLFGTNVGASSLDGVADSTYEAADAQDELANATDEAGKAAKGALASFDKLNVLTQPKEKSGGGGGLGDVGLPGEEDLLPHDKSRLGRFLDELELKLIAFKDKILAFFTLFKPSIDNLKQGFSDLWEAIKNTFAMMTDPDTVFGKFVLFLRDVLLLALEGVTAAFAAFANWAKNNPEGFTAILAVLAAIAVAIFVITNPIALVIAGIVLLVAAITWLVQNWDLVKEKAVEVWEKIKEIWYKMGENIYENGLKPILKTFTETFNAIVGLIWQAYANIFNWLTDTVNNIKNFIDGLPGWFNDNVVKPIVDWFKQAWVDIKEYFEFLWDAVRFIWGYASSWFDIYVIHPIVYWFKQAWIDIEGFFTDAWDGIMSVWETVSSWFKDNVTEPVKTFFSDAWDSIKGFFTDAWDNIKLTWETVSTWFQQNVIDPVTTAWDTATSSISTFFTDIWEDIKAVWDDVAGWFKDNVLNPVIGFINGLIGAVETAINWIVDGLNTISFDIPAWLGGGTFGVNLTPVGFDRIPELATGAVIPANAPFAAVLGDQRSGTNIEAPLKTIEQAVDNVLSRRGINTGTDNGLIHNVIKLDGQVLYEAVKKIDRRVGTSLISGSGIR